MPPAYPPTVIVRHARERKAKCTLEPLLGRADLCFLTYPLERIPALEGYVRLALEGPRLGKADDAAGVLLIDATWRLVRPIEALLGHVPPRSLPCALTAYPRASKLFEDPEGGLASVEALYLAHRILGRDVGGLLAGYRGAAWFLERNRALLEGLGPVA